jgi:CheY-like chemotaxis protein
LEQVVMNLVINARDAMPRGGKISIETATVERNESDAQSHPEAHPGRYVMLEVSDNGIGMDEETRKRIFEPFFTTKEPGKGTGLGLSMVQGIVAQSGGYIEVTSEPGRGTSFKVYLPSVEETAADGGMPEAVRAVGGKETILVVEDEVEVREYAVAVLKNYGYRVIRVENPGEALSLFQQGRERIDLILTDAALPDISGLELAGRLEKLQPGINVLLMSGSAGKVTPQNGVSEEDARIIQKPFTPEQLAIKIREVLGR